MISTRRAGRLNMTDETLEIIDVIDHSDYLSDWVTDLPE